MGAAGSGQQLFAHGLGEKAQTEDAAHRKILDALLRNSRITGLCIEIGLHAGKANDEEHHEAAQRKKDAVFRRGIGAALVLFAQTFGQHGVHAYAGATPTAIITFCSEKARDTAVRALSLTWDTNTESTTL